MQCSRLLVRDSTRQAKFPSNFLRTWTSGKRNFPIGVKLHSQHRVAEVIDSHIVFLSFNTFYILIFWVVFLFTMSVYIPNNLFIKKITLGYFTLFILEFTNNILGKVFPSNLVLNPLEYVKSNFCSVIQYTNTLVPYA